MSDVGIGTSLPNPPTQPIVEAGGIIERNWFLFFVALWRRTGSAIGVDVAAVEATAVAAEASADASLKIAQNLDDLNDVSTARGNLGLGSAALQNSSAFLQTVNTVGGWVDPTGAGSRATFDMNWTTGVSNPPTQAEVTAVRDQLVVVGKRLGQLEIDLKVVQGIKT